MKKTLLLGLGILLAFNITACSTKENGGQVVQEEKSSSVDYSNIDESSETVYGKVKSIVGNEIEFELAKTPEGVIAGVEKEEEEEKEEGNSEGFKASMMTPAAQTTEDPKVAVGEIEKNNPLVELEFTGELKNIIIPTGIEINVLSGKSSTGLGAIKEGTYLRIVVDDNKAENPTIKAVDVIS